jgi:hypothetical protein
MKVTEIKDITKLQWMVTDLWCLLDDIDTLDDACRSNDEAFRSLTRDIQKRRNLVLVSDGYELFTPSADT